jgi:hypothetical protein
VTTRGTKKPGYAIQPRSTGVTQAISNFPINFVTILKSARQVKRNAQLNRNKRYSTPHFMKLSYSEC